MYLFGIPHASSTRAEYLSSETSRNATFQEGSAVDANDIDLNYLTPSLASLRARAEAESTAFVVKDLTVLTLTPSKSTFFIPCSGKLYAGHCTGRTSFQLPASK